MDKILCPKCKDELEWSWCEYEYYYDCTNKECDYFIWYEDYKKIEEQLEYQARVDKLLKRLDNIKWKTDFEIVYTMFEEFKLTSAGSSDMVTLTLKNAEGLLDDLEEVK